MQHLEEGTIHAWLDGELSAAEQAQAERHVAECADCAAAVAEARGMIAGASRIVSALDVARGAGGGGVLPRQSAKPAAARSVWHSLRLTPTRAALAASILVAAGALFTVNHATSNKMAPFADAVRAPQIAMPRSAGPVPASDAAASPKPTLAAAVDSTAPRAAVTVTKQSAAPQRARTVQPSTLAEAKRGDSVLRREVQAANAVASTSASVAATEKAAAPPPSAPASNVRTPITPAASAAGAAGAVGGVVADRRSEPARALDSLDKTRPDTVRAAPESRRQAFQSSPLRLENVITTGAATGRFDLVGCYQIKPDSSALLHFLPNWFALERTTGAAMPNPVRAVTPDGRKDSVVTGSSWVQISNDKAQIQSTVGTKHQVVSLQLTSLGGVSGQASTSDGMRPISVFRATCRP
jgi:hypothetical protein